MIETAKPERQYKYLQFISMFYISVLLVTVVFCGRLVNIYGHIMAITTTLMPFRYAIADLVTEIYGYKSARKLIWYGVICELFFVFLCYCLLNAFSSDTTLQSHYDFVFSKLARIFFGCLFALVISNFINIYCISKWKILVKGRFFFLRSMGSTFIGITVFSIVTLFILFWGTINNHDLINLMTTTVLVKIIMEPVIALVTTIFVLVLKKAEKLNTYDNEISYNPFSLE